MHSCNMVSLEAFHNVFALYVCVYVRWMHPKTLFTQYVEKYATRICTKLMSMMHYGTREKWIKFWHKKLKFKVTVE